MKRTLDHQQVQHWTLMGLPPMQRVTLRRHVEALSVERKQADHDFSVCWSVMDDSGIEILESISPQNEEAITDIAERPGIVIVDRKYFERNLDRQAWNSSIGMVTRPCSQIRLLWSWEPDGGHDLNWCTELSFDGVIHDIPSLRRWAAACFEKGFRSMVQTNGLLAGIRLPKIHA